MEFIELNNGLKIPKVGFGTAYIEPDKFPSVIKTAIDCGYRMFDTAWSYNNEKILGQSLKQSGIKRTDFFITTKLHANQLYFTSYKFGRKGILNIRNFTSIGGLYCRHSGCYMLTI